MIIFLIDEGDVDVGRFESLRCEQTAESAAHDYNLPFPAHPTPTHSTSRSLANTSEELNFSCAWHPSFCMRSDFCRRAIGGLTISNNHRAILHHATGRD